MEMKPWNNQRMIMLCLLGVLVISINPQGTSAADFFVATNGNNYNSGSIGSPFLTLEKAASVMAPGDRMLIRAGTYQRTTWDLNVPSGGGSWSTATRVQAYNGETVILTPADPTANGTDVIRLPAGKSYIIFDGLILDGLRSGTSKGGRMGFRFADGMVGGVEAVNPSHHVRLSDLEIRNNHHSSILTTDAHHLEFINCMLHHAHNYGIYISSGDNLMQGCDIHDHNGYGIHNYSAHTYKPNNNIFKRNRLYNNGKSGIVIAQSTGVKFINNLSYNNGTGGEDLYTGADRYGIHVNLGVSNVTLFNNTTYDNAKGELRIGDTASNTIVRNNIFWGTKSTDYTIHIMALSGLQTPTTLTDNLIYHTNPSFYYLNQGGATIRNNLNSNPLFVNAGIADFHLDTGSPAIGKGIVLEEVKYDFDNVPRGVPFDIGAYAFDLSSSLPSVSERPATPKNVQVY
jgi:parallel beta helix pectate lyase-like protein